MKLTPQQRQLEKIVRKEHPGLLSNLPGEKKQQLLSVLQAVAGQQGIGGQVTVTQTTTSPVPPAELLAGYNAAFPDGANRLFSLVESQTNHRHTLETMTISAQLQRTKWGQIIAAVIALSFGGLSAYCASLGHAALAGTIATSTTLGLVGIFITGKIQQERNLDKKAPK